MSRLALYICLASLLVSAGCDTDGKWQLPTFDSGRSRDAPAPGRTDGPSAARAPEPAPAGAPPQPPAMAAWAREQARARAEGERQAHWLSNRLEQRVAKLREAAQAASGHVEAATQAIAAGKPALVRADRNAIARMDARADRLRRRLAALAGRYTDSFLENDPLANELRAELAQIDREKADRQAQGADTALQAARTEAAKAGAELHDAELGSADILARLEAYRKSLESRLAPPPAAQSDPDLAKAQEAVFTAWRNAYRMREASSGIALEP